MNPYSVEAYLGAVLGFASLAAAALGGTGPARYMEVGAGAAALVLAPFVWLESRRATAALVAVAAVAAGTAAYARNEGAPAAILLALSLASAAVGAYILALRRRGSGVHPLDLPVYG
ncbi:MAG: hypothetical protein ACP5NG_00385 [Conexivisphaera sp.]